MTAGAADSAKNRSGVNVWGYFTVDDKRGILYMPLGAPNNDRVGVDRPGNNLFGSSLVAVDANTGKYLWHFQVTHHDIWDNDTQDPPVLMDVHKDGKTIPAVLTVNKNALVFILDRVTGKPIFGVEERPVPQSKVPGEKTSPTQPFPVKPEQLSQGTLSPRQSLQGRAGASGLLREAGGRQPHGAGLDLSAAGLQRNHRRAARHPGRGELLWRQLSIPSCICSSPM